MKVILDGDVEELSGALTLWYRISSQTPNQEIGKQHAIVQPVGSSKYAVIRNLDSYTVRKMQ